MCRREFIQALVAASACGIVPSISAGSSSLYDFAPFGDVRLLHITDTHAQLNPVYYREPHVNIGLGEALGRPPHIVGDRFFDYFAIAPSTPSAYAFAYSNFTELAEKFGRIGGYAYLKTLIDRLRHEYGSERTLLLDGGDSWQGSGTALWTRGMEMVEASNLLGVDIATGHWEFTYTPQEIQANLQALAGDFVAQNIFLTEDALFDEKPVFDEDTGHAFAPYVMKSLGTRTVAVIGQAFPYTPIANPRRNIPDWTFGIRAEELQGLVNHIRAAERPDAVILLSHNGMDVDLKLGEVVTGIDAVLGGHTHDAVPAALEVRNSQGTTLVTNAGSNGKFVGVLDLKFTDKGVSDYRYRLLPVFGNFLEADAGMEEFIAGSRAPFSSVLDEKLAVTESLLFRRGNFNGTFDEVICNALLHNGDAQIALSPGFRWGTSVIPGQTISMEDVLSQTAMTYPETYVREMSGETLKLILEDVADNSFNSDPFYQQGGDMVRTQGLTYTLNPANSIGKRISQMRLDNGDLIEADKNYMVAGWATVGEVSPGPPIWELVADYLRAQGVVRVDRVNQPRLVIGADNPGVGMWPAT
ncbi:MAG: thiosulfohydrolase SoxB [Acidiferrobacterales bacterium]|nr:thiosulfohydrolase SoxB [Acidiferrobacterales bacterium]